MKNIFKTKIANAVKMLFCLALVVLLATGCQNNKPKFEEVVVPDTPTVFFMARYKSEKGSNYIDNGFFIDTDGNVYDIEYSNNKTKEEDIICPENNKKISQELESKIIEIRKKSKPKTSIDQLKVRELLSLGQRIDVESGFNKSNNHGAVNESINRYAFFVNPQTKVSTLCVIKGKDEGKIDDTNGNKFASESYIVFEQIENLKK